MSSRMTRGQKRASKRLRWLRKRESRMFETAPDSERRRILQAETVSTPDIWANPGATMSRRRHSRRNPSKAVIGIGAVALLGVGGLVWWLMKRKAPAAQGAPIINVTPSAVSSPSVRQQVTSAALTSAADALKNLTAQKA